MTCSHNSFLKFKINILKNQLHRRRKVNLSFKKRYFLLIGSSVIEPRMAVGKREKSSPQKQYFFGKKIKRVNEDIFSNGLSFFKRKNKKLKNLSSFPYAKRIL